MKKICFLVLFMASILFSISVYADGYCPENEDQTHHYDAFVNMNNEHPHAGYLECFCGARYNLKRIYNYECQECREKLCQEGYHYYLNELSYNEENGEVYLIGSCMCGDQTCLDIYVDGESGIVPRDKLFYSNDELIVDPIYSHVVLVNDNEVQAFSDVECEGQCAACSYVSEYIEEIYETSIWDYEHENGEYYEGYVEERQDERMDYYYDDYTEDDYSGLQEWLDDIRELFR